MVASAAALATPAQAASTTYLIGVDNATPSGHNFMYMDFFPRSGVNILSGDVIDFRWNTGSLDGFHTVTLLKAGESPSAAWNNNPPVVPDADDGANVVIENPAVFSPSNPACGTAANPCTFDPTTAAGDLNSGGTPSAPGNDFYVKITAPAGTTVNYVCLIHPGMTGSVNVVASGASLQSDLDTAATNQYNADTTAALAAEAANSNAPPTINSNGSKTWNVTTGTETPNVQIAEFLPQNMNIQAGDSVLFTSKAHDPHTVTFPSGAASSSLDFHTFLCEGTGSTDTPATPGPPPTACANPANFEAHFNAPPVGPTAISSASTVATAGVIAAAPLPFPGSYTFSFPNAGTFSYQCKVHDHMTGQIAVTAAGTSMPVMGSPMVQSGQLTLSWAGLAAFASYPANTFSYGYEITTSKPASENNTGADPTRIKADASQVLSGVNGATAVTGSDSALGLTAGASYYARSIAWSDWNANTGAFMSAAFVGVFATSVTFTAQ